MSSLNKSVVLTANELVVGMDVSEDVERSRLLDVDVLAVVSEPVDTEKTGVVEGEGVVSRETVGPSD